MYSHYRDNTLLNIKINNYFLEPYQYNHTNKINNDLKKMEDISNRVDLETNLKFIGIGENYINYKDNIINPYLYEPSRQTQRINYDPISKSSLDKNLDFNFKPAKNKLRKKNNK